MEEYKLCEIQDLSQGRVKPSFGIRCPDGEIFNICDDKSVTAEIVGVLNNYAVSGCHICDVALDFMYGNMHK